MDDITALLMEKNRDVADMAKKVMKKLKEEVEKKQQIAMQQESRSDDGRPCRNAWSGLENKGQEVGCERNSEEKEVQSEILAYQKE